MTRLTEAHLNKLTDEDLRTLALRILNDAVSALNTGIDEHGLTNHHSLEPARFHEATDWLRKALTHPDDGYDRDTWKRHEDAVLAFRNATWGIGESASGSAYEFPPHLNAEAVAWIFCSVYYDGGTTHRPSAKSLYTALTQLGGGFIPSHETTAGYALKVLCDSDDPRLPALSESYLQSGLQVNLRPAINRATRQLARLDELADLNR